jgi:hypothetical protein
MSGLPPLSADHVPSAWRAAYEATTYRVFIAGRHVDLRLGVAHPRLRAWLEVQQTDKFAIITAYNPGSILQAPWHNRRRQRHLRAELRRRGWLAGWGKNLADRGGWPVEKTCLALGLDEEAARRLGVRYGQNAVVVGDADAVPRLLWIKEDT